MINDAFLVDVCQVMTTLSSNLLETFFSFEKYLGAHSYYGRRMGSICIGKWDFAV